LSRKIIMTAPPIATQHALDMAAELETVEVPPTLESGDHLTRAEFEWRYNRRPDIKKAELIEGVVYMSSPVRFTQHSHPHANVMFWLVGYTVATPGVTSGDNPTVRLDLDNEPQPDGCLRIEATHGGQSRLDADGYVAGAPELIAEVAASSASYDLHTKLNAYRRNQVQEYVVLLTEERQLRWHRLRQGRYELLAPDAAGIIRSEVFPSLWLDVQALLAGNMARVLEVLQQGLASADHAAFVAGLQAVAEAHTAHER
jgi:Uma2 family endonuclease